MTKFQIQSPSLKLTSMKYQACKSTGHYSNHCTCVYSASCAILVNSYIAFYVRTFLCPSNLTLSIDLVHEKNVRTQKYKGFQFEDTIVSLLYSFILLSPLFWQYHAMYNDKQAHAVHTQTIQHYIT